MVFFEKAKRLFSNPEIQKQIAKTAGGSFASIAGVKSFYDVPKYFHERWKVRGMFGKGKGLSGSVEELLGASFDNRKSIESAGVKNSINTQEIGTQNVEEGNPQESGSSLKHGKVLNAIQDLNSRLRLTREGDDRTSRGSEQRKLIARALRENRNIKNVETGKANQFAEKIGENPIALKAAEEYEQKREMNLENARAKMTEILDNYTTTKTTGMQAARETLNTVCVTSGALALRPIGYGLMDAVERYQRLDKEVKVKTNKGEQADSPAIWRDVIVGSVGEAFQEIKDLKNAGIKDKGSIKTALDGVKALGKVARYVGFGMTAGYHPENLEKSVNSLLDFIDGDAGAGEIVQHFQTNLEHVTHISLPKNFLGVNHDNAIFQKNVGINHDSAVFHENSAAGINHDSAIFHEDTPNLVHEGNAGVNHDNAIFHENNTAGINHDQAVFHEEPKMTPNHADTVGKELHRQVSNRNNHLKHPEAAKAMPAKETPIKTVDNILTAEKAPTIAAPVSYAEHLKHIRELEAQRAEIERNIQLPGVAEQQSLSSVDHPVFSEGNALNSEQLNLARIDGEISAEKMKLADIVGGDSSVLQTHESAPDIVGNLPKPSAAEAIQNHDNPIVQHQPSPIIDNHVPTSVAHETHLDSTHNGSIDHHPQNTPVAHEPEQVAHANVTHPQETDQSHDVEKNVLDAHRHSENSHEFDNVKESTEHFDKETALATLNPRTDLGRVRFDYDKNGNIEKSYIKLPMIYRAEKNETYISKDFPVNTETVAIQNSKVLSNQIIRYLHMYNHLEKFGNKKEAHAVLAEMWGKITLMEKNVGVNIFDRSKLPVLEN